MSRVRFVLPLGISVVAVSTEGLPPFSDLPKSMLASQHENVFNSVGVPLWDALISACVAGATRTNRVTQPAATAKMNSIPPHRPVRFIRFLLQRRHNGFRLHSESVV